MFFDEKIVAELQKQFSVLKKKVKMVLFTQELECQFCRETKQLLQELAGVSDKIELEIKNFVVDSDEAAKYDIDKIPAIVLLDDEGKYYGMKYYGIPSGYEFSSLLSGILLLSTGETGLPENVINKLKDVNTPVHLQVFVTPTCPYCPQAVITAHKFAYLNENIKADMIEATEFPHLSNKYNVRGVPRTVINETSFVEGAVPEQMFLDKIMLSLMEEQAK